MSSSVWYLSFSKKKIEFKRYPKKKSKKINTQLDPETASTINIRTKKTKNKSSRNFLTVLLFFISLIFFSNLISAAPINDTLHLNLQTTFSNGTIEPGTFTFRFNLTESSSSSCLGPVVYNHSIQRATDSRGIVSIYLPTVGSGGGNLSSLNFDTQYYLCYYRDSVLKNVSQIGRVPYSFRATQINLSEISIDSNLNLTDIYNVTNANYGFFSNLGSFLSRVTNLFVQAINVSGNLVVGGDINSTGIFYGNGSGLTDISADNANTLDNFDSSFFMPLNTSVVGNFDFNGGWQNNGLSISGGDLFAQTIFVYNITSLNVTRQDLTINDTLIVFGNTELKQNLTVDTNTLFVDSNTNRVGINTTTPQNLLNVVGDANITGILYFGTLDGEANLNVNSSAFWDNLNTPNDITSLTGITDINSTDWTNVTITESQISDLTHTTDTNETTRFDNLVGNCSASDFIQGVFDNGQKNCGTPSGSGDITSVQGDSYITNGSNSGDVNLVFNETKLNNTIDDRDTNETTRFNFLVNNDCSSGELVIGVQSNGTVLCATDGNDGTTNIFDQILNTTSNVTFNLLNLTGGWLNVTITESQISDFQSYILTSNEANLNVNSSAFWDNLNTPNDITSLTGITDINSTDWTNVTITESQISDLTHTTNTNETTRFNFLVNNDCSSGELVIGVQVNGTVLCATDASGGTMSSFILGASSGTNQTITDGNTAFIVAGTGITTIAAATDQVTIAATLGTSIISGEITDGTIAAVDLAPSSVNTTHIVTDTILAGDIAANAITNSELGPNSVDLTSDALSTAYAGTGIGGGGTAALNFDCSEVEGDGIICSGESILFDCSDVDGTGIGCSGEDLTITGGTCITADTSGVSVTANCIGDTQIVQGSIDQSEIQNDVLDFVDFQDTLDLDSPTQINVGSGEEFNIDLDGTADFQIRDVTTVFADFQNDGDVVLGNNNELFMDTSTARVGIGTSTPQDTLNVVGGNLNMSNNDIEAVNKLTVNTIDPLYTISGVSYATYVPSIVGGVKEEVTGTVRLNSDYTIDFKNLKRGSNLWLFYQTTDFGGEMENLQIILTPSFNGNVWYEKNPLENTLTIYGEASGEVSYRLTANRFDWRDWSNYADNESSGGFIIEEKSYTGLTGILGQLFG